MTTRRFLAALALAAAATALLPAPAPAQTPSPAGTRTTSSGPDTASSVSLLPRDASADDPHGGSWFLFTLDPGSSGRAVASLTNPTAEPVQVTLQLREVVFTEDGTPELGAAADGLGAWGAFEQQQVEVPPSTTVPVAFQLTVPSGTAPGDHIGAAVAVTRHELDGTEVVQRIATRVVVTVPGDAARSLEITRVELERAGGLFPGPVVARVTVRNTGSIRLAPRVTVADLDASGSRLLTRASEDTYVAEVPVSPFGGVVRLPVEVTDTSGVTRRVDESLFVVPWWLVGLAVVVAVVVARRRRDTGHGPDEQLRADVRRLERLVVDVQRRLDVALAAPVPTDGGPSHRDRVNSLELSLLRARRAGEWDVFAALALALHELTGDAHGVLAEAARFDTPYRDDLEQALAAPVAP
ncbi:MAG: hypothetical protein KY461_02615 [Actinobacteria bacterium]|nr:hypothetical protein [Actinomycetota bacterium]